MTTIAEHLHLNQDSFPKAQKLLEKCENLRPDHVVAYKWRRFGLDNKRIKFLGEHKLKSEPVYQDFIKMVALLRLVHSTTMRERRESRLMPLHYAHMAYWQTKKSFGLLQCHTMETNMYCQILETIA